MACKRKVKLRAGKGKKRHGVRGMKKMLRGKKKRGLRGMKKRGLRGKKRGLRGKMHR